MSGSTSLGLLAANRQTLGDSVTASLRQAIFSGVLRPGVRLAQSRIATELGVSQAPVREALATLEREGLLQRSTNSSAVVAILSPTDIEEICSLRSVLAVLGVRLATRLATAEELDRMDATIQATERATSPEEIARLDLEFHELLMTAAKHQRLLASWRTLHAQLNLALLQQRTSSSETLEYVVKGHVDLLAQIRARNEERAVELLEAQLEGFYQCALRLNMTPNHA